MTRCRQLVIRLVLCALALAVSIGIAAALIITKNQQKAAEAAAASEAAARAAEEEAARMLRGDEGIVPGRAYHPARGGRTPQDMRDDVRQMA